jgi:hypothetical protein
MTIRPGRADDYLLHILEAIGRADVDLSVVWDTVQRDLPKLTVQVRQLLDTLTAGRSDAKL